MAPLSQELYIQRLSQIRSSGLTLIELLVAMVISLVLLNGLIYSYLSSLQTSSQIDAQSRLQRNARFAAEFISQDLRQVGYSGCRVLDSMAVNTIRHAGTEATGLEFYSFVRGRRISWIQGTYPDVDPDSDVMVVQRFERTGVSLSEAMAGPSAAVKIARDIGAQPGDVMYISDCQKSAIFAVTDVTDDGTTIHHTLTRNTSGSSNHSTSLTNDGSSFDTNARLFRFVQTIYTVRPSAVANNQGVRMNSLYADDDEIVEGIDEMKVLFGVDANDDHWPDRYSIARLVVPVDGFQRMIDVVAIRLIIKAHSVNAVGGAPLERVYIRTIHLRNKELERGS